MKGVKKVARTHLHLWNVVQANPHLLREGNDIHQNAESLKNALLEKAKNVFNKNDTDVAVVMEIDKSKSRTWEILIVFPVGAQNNEMIQVAGFLTKELETMGTARNMGTKRFNACHESNEWKKMKQKNARPNKKDLLAQAEALFKKK